MALEHNANSAARCVAPVYRPVRRLAQLYAGLALYGAGMALQIRAGLGLDPWDVFHQGIAQRAGLSFGTVVIVVGALVLLAWIPLRQRPGLGTVSNVIVIGLAVDAALARLPDAGSRPVAAAMLLGGVGLNGLAGAAYIGAGLGPGPRDGLMTGTVKRTGRSVRVVRTTIELTVLAAGGALGGSGGGGTGVYALRIGPSGHALLPPLTGRPREPPAPPAALASPSRY